MYKIIFAWILQVLTKVGKISRDKMLWIQQLPKINLEQN